MSGQLFDHGKDLWPEIQRAWAEAYLSAAQPLKYFGQFYDTTVPVKMTRWERIKNRASWKWDDFRRWLSNKIYNWEDDL